VFARRFMAILLLLFATGNAAAPRHPDSPVGRQAFLNCLASAETAWRSGQAADALRWYHSAKKVARAHNLTLSGRDAALIDLITRHEAGLAGPQPGRKPGCESDGTAQQPPGAGNPHHGNRLIADNSPTATTKVIPSPEPTAARLPKANPRTIPADTTEVYEPADATRPPLDAGSQAKQVPDSEPTSPIIPAPCDTAQPALQGSNPPEPVDETDTNPPAEPGPPNWPDSEPADDAEADNLVPPVTPPRTSAPVAPPRQPGDESETTTSATEAVDAQPTPVATAAATGADVTEHPVKLTADRSAVPIQISSPPSATPLPALETTATTLSQQFLGPLEDHELILVMFGPIVLALFILGLLTQEMPGPSRLLAWIMRRDRRTNSPNQIDPPAIAGRPSLADTTAQGHPGQVMLSVRIGTRRRNKDDFYTATIELPGLEPTRLVKRRDGSPLFRSRGAAANSARHLARRLGFDGIIELSDRRKAA